MTTNRTWEESRLALVAAGLDEETIEIARRLTAPSRCRRRAAAAEEAALAGAAELGCEGLRALAIAWALCELERHGVGGPSATGLRGTCCEELHGDRATRRGAWAAELGTGRAHARDGGAWGAAIAAAGHRLGVRLAHESGAIPEAVYVEAGAVALNVVELDGQASIVVTVADHQWSLEVSRESPDWLLEQVEAAARRQVIEDEEEGDAEELARSARSLRAVAHLRRATDEQPDRPV